MKVTARLSAVFLIVFCCYDHSFLITLISNDQNLPSVHKTLVRSDQKCRNLLVNLSLFHLREAAQTPVLLPAAGERPGADAGLHLHLPGRPGQAAGLHPRNGERRDGRDGLHPHGRSLQLHGPSGVHHGRDQERGAQDDGQQGAAAPSW